METTQQIIASDIQRNNYQTRNELYEAVDKIVYREIVENLDKSFYSINKYWKNYGTWRLDLWTNPYHFGREISDRLNRLSVITHDEFKRGSLDDFIDEISNEIQDWAEDYWSDKPWKEAEEDYR